MIKSVKDKDAHLWEVMDLDTKEPVRGVQWADDETGEIERLVFKNTDKSELLFVNGLHCGIHEKRNIKIQRKNL